MEFEVKGTRNESNNVLFKWDSTIFTIDEIKLEVLRKTKTKFSSRNAKGLRQITILLYLILVVEF